MYPIKPYLHLILVATFSLNTFQIGYCLHHYHSNDNGILSTLISIMVMGVWQALVITQMLYSTQGVAFWTAYGTIGASVVVSLVNLNNGPNSQILLLCFIMPTLALISLLYVRSDLEVKHKQDILKQSSIEEELKEAKKTIFQLKKTNEQQLQLLDNKSKSIQNHELEEKKLQTACLCLQEKLKETENSKRELERQLVSLETAFAEVTEKIQHFKKSEKNLQESLESSFQSMLAIERGSQELIKEKEEELEQYKTQLDNIVSLLPDLKIDDQEAIHKIDLSPIKNMIDQLQPPIPVQDHFYEQLEKKVVKLELLMKLKEGENKGLREHLREISLESGKMEQELHEYTQLLEEQNEHLIQQLSVFQKKRAEALWDFIPDNAEEKRQLTFYKGDVINVVAEGGEYENWWWGELSGKEGYFPVNYTRFLLCSENIPSL